jgi:hypothetical protein
VHRFASHFSLLALLIGLLLHLGSGSFVGGTRVEAVAEFEDCQGESTKIEGADADEDGVSHTAALPAVRARSSTLALRLTARVRPHPGYRSSLERPPDAHT